MTTFLVLLAIVVGVALYGVNIYNTLVKLKNRIENSFSQIEVQLKRRHDLIPNLIETAKGYMAHERETLDAVVSARSAAMAGLEAVSRAPGDPGALEQLASAEGALSGALGKLNVVMEAYPDLKANENMMQLSEELTATENKVAFSRQAFNDSATAYNTYRQSFPPNVFATMFGHAQDAALLEYEDVADIQAVPKVEF